MQASEDRILKGLRIKSAEKRTVEINLQDLLPLNLSLHMREAFQIKNADRFLPNRFRSSASTP